MKVPGLKGKTIRKLKEKISSTNGTSNKKKKSKPMIRKIEDGEDLTPPSAADIVDDIKELERVQTSKPAARQSSEVEHPLDESPLKAVNKLPSQLLKKAPASKVEEEELEKDDGLWKLQEPEIGQDIPDQDKLEFLSGSEDAESDSESSDEDENDYNEVDGTVAIIGNIVLIEADKCAPSSPYSTAPTEPLSPEEALKRSFEMDQLSDDGSFGDAKYVHKTTIYSVPEDEETKSLWQSMERNVQLSQNLLKDFNCEPHVEKTMEEFDCNIQNTDSSAVEVTVANQEEQEDFPTDERKSFGETIEKMSYIDVNKFQRYSDEHHSMDEKDLESVSMSVSTVQMGNVLNTSFDMPFDQKDELLRMQMGPVVIDPISFYVPPQVVDEEEFPLDEVNQEARQFLQEIEGQPQVQEEQEEATQASDSAQLYSTTLSVAKSVAEGVSVESVASVASATLTAADNLDKAAAPALDTILEKTSKYTPTVFEGFFQNPKPSTARASKQQRDKNDQSFNSQSSGYGSEYAYIEPDDESVESRFGFDKTMDRWFASETFTAVANNVPDCIMKLVMDDATEDMHQPGMVEAQ